MSKHILTPRLNQLAASIALVAGSIALVPAAYAAAPAAGTTISNVATASYIDASNRPQDATSNIVQATVIQVASFTLVDNRTINSTPNAAVSLSHTLTNTGNGIDTFTINTANISGDNFEFSTIQVFKDADGNGLPDDNNNLAGSTVTLNAGQSLNLVVVTTTPASATSGQNGQLTISATTGVAGTASADQTKTNTDRVDVTENAVIQVTKSITGNVSTVKTGDTYEYVLTYTNTGNNTATNVILKDLLPDNLVYQAGSAKWNNGSALTEANDGTDKFKFVTATGEVNFVVDSVAPNATGTLKFKVTVGPATDGAAVATTGAYVPAGQINNNAQFSYDPDGAGAIVQTQDASTNTSTVTVAADYSGAINESNTYSNKDGDTANGVADTQTRAINQGQTATFTTYVWNRGNTPESYNLSSALTGLAAGTQVKFYKADGSTPLTDSNNDLIVDIGTINPGQSAAVVVKVTPPLNSVVSGSVLVTSRPIDNSSLSDTTTLVVNVTAASVDLSRSNAGTAADGAGTYAPGTTVQTVNTNPGAPATFQLAISNGAASGLDNFNLGLATPLPAGWSVVFYDADDTTGACSSNVITNTGNLAAGATNKVCAVVTPPADTAAGDQDVIFSIYSPATGLGDQLKDKVVVDTVRNFSLLPNRFWQVEPDGTITYSHTLTNTGNVAEPLSANSITAVNAPANTATVNLYVDLNNDGVAQSNEQIIAGALPTGTPTSLAKGQSIVILTKLQAPSNATDGQQFITTTTFTQSGIVGGAAAPAAQSVVDTTTVNDGQVRVAKQQAAANCTTGAITGSYVDTAISAKPGTCVSYKVTATNEGSAAVTSLAIKDSTPNYTKFVTIATVSPKTSAGTTVAVQPANNTAGSISTTPQNLTPTSSATLEFVVKIDD